MANIDRPSVLCVKGMGGCTCMRCKDYTECPKCGGSGWVERYTRKVMWRNIAERMERHRKEQADAN